MPGFRARSAVTWGYPSDPAHDPRELDFPDGI